MIRIMSNPSVSIVVPVYNVAPYVEDCIRSVMRQTYDGKMECIIVDDCGTDDSMAKVERLVSEYIGPIEFKILHHTHNRGLSAARNTGMDAATGDYLFFLDSDDELTDDCIEKLVKPLVKENFDVVLGSLRTINESGEIIPTIKEINIPNGTSLKQPDILQTYQKQDWLIAAWNKLYLTSFIRRNKLYFIEGILFEDVFWSFQIACLARSLYIVNQTTYHYRRRNGSITKATDSSTRAHAYCVSVMEMGKFVRERGLYNKAIHELILSEMCNAYYYSKRTPLYFISIYKRMRQYARPTFNNIIAANGKQISNYLRDLHFFLPSIIAPYWELSCVIIKVAIKRLF